MDYEMENFIEDFYEESSEIDDEYEFDASQFFDFTRQEFDSEIEEAERWFEVSGDYPNSPFIVKLNLGKLLSMEVVHNNSSGKGSSSTKSIGSNSDIDSKHGASMSKKNVKGRSCQVLQDTAKAKTKSANKLVQPRNSTLMKPTASHLAKQNKVQDINSSCSCTRCQKSSIKFDERSLQGSIGFDNLATKRQKLEIGYLRKVAGLKHKIALLHKTSKKVTVPREPELETQLRALRRRSKNSSAPSENERPKGGCIYKASSANRKAPSSPKSEKSKRQVPEFQVFHLKTMQRANQHGSAKVSTGNKANQFISSGATVLKRPNSLGTLKPGKPEASIKSKDYSLREKVFPCMVDADVIQDETKLSTDSQLLESPPIEQLAKLSLGSDTEGNNASLQRRVSIKASNENSPDSFQAEFWRCHAKPSQCGGPMTVH